MLMMFNPSSLSALEPISRRASSWRKWKLTDAHARSPSHPREADWRVYTQQSARPAPHLEPEGKGRFLTAFIQLSLESACADVKEHSGSLNELFAGCWISHEDRRYTSTRTRMHGAAATQTFISSEVDDKRGNMEIFHPMMETAPERQMFFFSVNWQTSESYSPVWHQFA